MDGQLIALDAKTGKVVWEKEAVRPEEGETETASGLAATLGGKPVQGSSRLGFKMPPLVADGLVIVGVTGAGYGLHIEDEAGGLDGGAVVGIEGGYGRRGWLAAYDAKTGDERWRWYVTPAEGWEGASWRGPPTARRSTATSPPRRRRPPPTATRGGWAAAPSG